MYLPDEYHRHISLAIDEKGVYPHQMLVEDKEGKLGVYALMLPEPHQVLNSMMKALMENPKQLIYGMDRYCKPGQGTTLNDAVVGAYWNGEAWRPFVIEYQHEPRIVKPLEWDNEWWKRAIKSELTDFFDRALGQKP